MKHELTQFHQIGPRCEVRSGLTFLENEFYGLPENWWASYPVSS